MIRTQHKLQVDIFLYAIDYIIIKHIVTKLLTRILRFNGETDSLLDNIISTQGLNRVAINYSTYSKAEVSSNNEMYEYQSKFILKSI